MHYCDTCSDCECTCVAYCEECGCHDVDKPPASVAYTPQPTRGDEREGSTSTERQLSGPLSRSDLSFAAKHRVRRSYPTCIYTPSALPRVRDTHCRPRVRLGTVLHSPLPPHSADLRSALPLNIQHCPERSQAG